MYTLGLCAAPRPATRGVRKTERNKYNRVLKKKREMLPSPRCQGSATAGAGAGDATCGGRGEAEGGELLTVPPAGVRQGRGCGGAGRARRGLPYGFQQALALGSGRSPGTLPLLLQGGEAGSRPRWGLGEGKQSRAGRAPAPACPGRAGRAQAVLGLAQVWEMLQETERAGGWEGNPYLGMLSPGSPGPDLRGCLQNARAGDQELWSRLGTGSSTAAALTRAAPAMASWAGSFPAGRAEAGGCTGTAGGRGQAGQGWSVQLPHGWQGWAGELGAARPSWCPSGGAQAWGSRGCSQPARHGVPLGPAGSALPALPPHSGPWNKDLPLPALQPWGGPRARHHFSREMSSAKSSWSRRRQRMQRHWNTMRQRGSMKRAQMAAMT